MSKFNTRIPVDVAAVVALLPRKSTVSGVSLEQVDDGSHEVVVEWENDWMKSPFTFPVEWPVEKLRSREIPGKVTNVLPPIEQKQVDTVAKMVDKKRK